MAAMHSSGAALWLTWMFTSVCGTRVGRRRLCMPCCGAGSSCRLPRQLRKHSSSRCQRTCVTIDIGGTVAAAVAMGMKNITYSLLIPIHVAG